MLPQIIISGTLKTKQEVTLGVDGTRVWVEGLGHRPFDPDGSDRPLAGDRKRKAGWAWNAIIFWLTVSKVTTAGLLATWKDHHSLLQHL
jgi:hypothetical protein